MGEINIEKIIQRLIRIVKLDQTVYKEIEEDQNANTEAAVIVIAATILAAVGTLLSGAGIGATVLGLILGPLVGWLLWSWLTMFVGTRLFGGQTDFWEMARVLGYANVTRALGIFSFIPCVGALIGLVAFVLSLVIGFFAVREALDLPTEKAVLTIVISWVVMVVISIGIGMLFGVGAGIAGSLG